MAAYVAAFNEAVAAGDFGAFLLRFADDAVIRFENLSGGASLEFAGRAAYTRAYTHHPPDDRIDVVGPVAADGASLAVPFAWRRDGARAVLRLTRDDGDPGLISAMTVVFG